MPRTKVAVFPVDAVGHVNPLLAIVSALSGEAEVFGVGPPRLAESFVAAGGRYIGVAAPRHTGDERPPPSETARRLFVWPLETIEKSIRFVAGFRPDVVLYDVASVEGFVAARHLGVPSASLVTFPGFGALGDGYAEQHGRPHPLLTAANERYRELFGVDVLGEAALPVLFPSADLSIVTSAEPLARPVDADRTPLLFSALSGYACEFVGACIDARTRPSVEFPFRLLDEADGRSIALFSLGTVLPALPSPAGGAPSGRDFLRAMLGRLVDALGEDPELLVVAAIGSRLTEDEQPRWPGNFVARAFVPQLRLLSEYADVFITHHGANSTAESILAGVPMVSLPGDGDQLTGAEIAIGSGAAVALWDLRDPFSTCDAGLLGRAVRTALHEESYRRACADLRAMMRTAGGAGQAARLVMDLAGAFTRGR